MERLRITWFGHSTFLLHTPGGRRVLFDPWLVDNPACPESMKKPPKCDLILVTHGHGDHMGDVVSAARESGCGCRAATSRDSSLTFPGLLAIAIGCARARRW